MQILLDSDNSKKNIYRIVAGLGLIVLLIFGSVVIEDFLIDHDKGIVYGIVNERIESRKDIVTVKVEFTVNKIKYITSGVVSGNERLYNFKIQIGDTIIVEYYKNYPNFNRIVLLEPAHYKVKFSDSH